MSDDFVIAGKTIPLRSRQTIEITLPQLYTHTPLSLPVTVIRGAKKGPHLFVSAAIHGDELNGTEIIRRLLKQPALKRLKGTLIAVPIVNVYGLIHHSRYLPDRRDLNRTFPGSEKGSLAARLAHVFMEEIVCNCSHGIDLHTGAIHRSNLPQIRANLDDPETLSLAKQFGVPVLLNSNLRDGSLREAAAEQGIPMLLYEAGEALRFDEISIRAGVKGVINVMRSLEMLPPSRSRRQTQHEPFIARSSTWVRASISGLFRKVCALGSRVKRGEVIGLIDDPFGGEEYEVTASVSGIVIGCSVIPLVHEGEAIFHIARFQDIKEVAGEVESFQSKLTPEDIVGTFNQKEPPEPPIV
jgi:predicted deacylase